MAGARLVLMERFEAGRCLQLTQEQSITLLYSVPQVLAALLAWPQLDEYDLHTVRFTQCGAAPVPPVLAHRFQEHTHITVMTSYAQIEALLLEHPAVADAAVIAKPDEEAGEITESLCGAQGVPWTAGGR